MGHDLDPSPPPAVDSAASPSPVVRVWHPCPRCRRIDYEPLPKLGARCLVCGTVWKRDAEAQPALPTSPSSDRRASRPVHRRLPCPVCGCFAYELPLDDPNERRCLDCGHVWTPGGGA